MKTAIKMSISDLEENNISYFIYSNWVILGFYWVGANEMLEKDKK